MSPVKPGLSGACELPGAGPRKTRIKWQIESPDRSSPHAIHPITPAHNPCIHPLRGAPVGSAPRFSCSLSRQQSFRARYLLHGSTSGHADDRTAQPNQSSSSPSSRRYGASGGHPRTQSWIADLRPDRQSDRLCPLRDAACHRRRCGRPGLGLRSCVTQRWSVAAVLQPLEMARSHGPDLWGVVWVRRLSLAGLNESNGSCSPWAHNPRIPHFPHCARSRCRFVRARASAVLPRKRACTH